MFLPTPCACRDETPLRLPLAAFLREATREAHERAEALTNLPGAVASDGDYARCLMRFHALYAPLYRRLLAFEGWCSFGFDPARRILAALLAEDLARLGLIAGGGTAPMRGFAEAPSAACPAPRCFPEALGTLYVVEGATRGGAAILRQLRARGLPAASAASAFFGAADREAWQAIRLGLDRFGDAHESDRQAVLHGALESFGAVGAWMTASNWSAA